MFLRFAPRLHDSGPGALVILWRLTNDHYSDNNAERAIRSTVLPSRFLKDSPSQSAKILTIVVQHTLERIVKLAHSFLHMKPAFTRKKEEVRFNTRDLCIALPDLV